jgi:hypothetical protein
MLRLLVCYEKAGHFAHRMARNKQLPARRLAAKTALLTQAEIIVFADYAN